MQKDVSNFARTESTKFLIFARVDVQPFPHPWRRFRAFRIRWYFSGAGGQIQVFMVKFGYVMRKFGLHKGYPLLYYTRGGSRRLILKIRPQWSEI
jgi:hypothetical protein